MCSGSVRGNVFQPSVSSPSVAVQQVQTSSCRDLWHSYGRASSGTEATRSQCKATAQSDTCHFCFVKLAVALICWHTCDPAQCKLRKRSDLLSVQRHRAIRQSPLYFYHICGCLLLFHSDFVVDVLALVAFGVVQQLFCDCSSFVLIRKETFLLKLGRSLFY